MTNNKTKTRNEKFVENWFAQNGFDFTMEKQYNSKTVWCVSKNAVDEKFELPYDVPNVSKYMEQFNESFKLKEELVELRKQVTKESDLVPMPGIERLAELKEEYSK